MLVRVIGFGICGSSHLTVEAINNLKAAKKVLFFPMSHGGTEWLFEKLGIKNYEDMSGLYLNGAKDTENYSRIVRKVLDEANSFEDVALLVPGHPRVGVTTLRWLERESDSNNSIELRVIEGISSLDTMINDLRRDLLEPGTVIIDANRLLLFEYQLDPRMDHYIYHVCSIGTSRTHVEEPSRDNHINLLKFYLLRFFHKEQSVSLVKSSMSICTKPTIIEGQLQSLEDLLSYIDFGTSLFIPGFTSKKINRSFLELDQ